LLKRRYGTARGKEAKKTTLQMGIKTLGKGLNVITMSDDSFVNGEKWRWDGYMYIDFVYKRREKDLRKITNKTTVERLYLFILFFYTVYTKIGVKLIQQNGTVEVQKYECRLGKRKRLAKLLRRKLLTMVELKSYMEELYMTKAHAMYESKLQEL
jgi:hypothetical protein